MRKKKPENLKRGQTEVSRAEYFDAYYPEKCVCIRTYASEDSKRKGATQNIVLNKLTANELVRCLIKSFALNLVESPTEEEKSKSTVPPKNIRAAKRKTKA